MDIIDVHCHIGKGAAYSQSVDELLREMDNHLVSKAVVVPVDRCLAVDNREGNNEVLAAMHRHPDRFIPFATANPWYGSRAVEELEISFSSGAEGVKLHPVLQGFSIIDEIVFPLIEIAVKHNKPVYFHTGTPSSCTPFQMTELAMRYPEGVFIMGHAAYSDFWNDVVDSIKPVSNIYIDTSHHLASFVRSLVQEVGADRIIYGSNSPHTSMSVEIEKITRYIKSDEQLEKIFSGNINRILGGA